MPYTSLSTVASGDTIDPAWGNLVDTNLDWLANPPSCRVYHNTTQSLPDSADTALVFNTERWDTAGMHDTGSNTGRITFATAGIYVVFAHIAVAAGTDYSQLYGYFRVNGANPIIGNLGMIGTLVDNTAGPFLTGSTLWKFAAADYVEVVVHQDNSANAARNVTAGSANGAYVCDFGAMWKGTG